MKRSSARRAIVGAAVALLTAAGLATPASATTEPDLTAQASAVRNAVVDAAKSYLGLPYRYATGWTCSRQAMDCECFNRNAIWDGTARVTGRGLQLNYWLQGQINQGRLTTTPRPGDLVFWDTDPHDGIPYGGDYDHTGIYIGGTTVIDANAVAGRVRYDSTTLGGSYRPIYVDVLAPNGY
ncbi:C40 family peptidase [Saccharothrix hoggarensis]|uniref:C40 family peptidase n=1 Tax=Saccharothrix hoggarensis TaxID=913853 RepID=A0ABW3QHP5_9PSEU